MSEPASELERLRAALTAAEGRASAAEAELAQARAVVSTSEAMIAGLKLEIALLRREQYGRSAERTARLIDQLELQLEELVTDAAEDRIRAEKTTKVAAFERRKPVRKPFPEHLPRERVVVPAPTSCECCGSDRIAKMGEDVTETLEVVPRQWKVIQTVREKFTCRACEKISQPAAPFHPIPRGWAGPSLLAMIVFEKFGQHQPLNRQAERYAREGVDLSLSTLADQIGAVAELLKPLHALIEAHVRTASRLHGDDTTVPLLARGGTKTARLWTYVRDDRPFGGTAPPAVVFRFSRDRAGEHPAEHLGGWQGILQADAYAGYNQLYRGDRKPGPVLPALCWSHARRKFFELADVEGNIRKGKDAKEISPIAFEAVKRIDALFAIERALNGQDPDARLAARRARSAPLVEDLERWLRGERALLSKHAKVAKAIDYLLSPDHWPGFTRFLDNGRVCLTNNAAERSLRGVALGRKSWLFAGSERGGQRAAFMYSLIVTAKLNGIDPQAWLADAIARISDLPVSRLPELLPWNWCNAAHPRIAA
ncbi:IS66 family transposase (plasmid) [Cereibacter azotoformans]|uniref:IS66 family transposase n=1 Tax=Cereibacter azotoformans TaxID=43057 RepID=UPI001EEB79CA|nr:IS66 family transposase [Cereibacter azotoformans]ULB12046.1 IS66 family transposase [Cereibacter azotoformans]